MDELWGIGRLARASGLTVSALRFYDGADVLIPAVVDPHTGYRGYTADQVVAARLLAGLRRTQMPLADIRQVLAHQHDRARVDQLLDAHLRNLEEGLTDARRELAAIRALLQDTLLDNTLLDDRENPMTASVLTFDGSQFAEALRAVRFAVSTDPESAALAGVLLDAAADTLTLVATDRYRLAVASIPCELGGPDHAGVVLAAFADAISATAATRVQLRFEGGSATARAGEVAFTSDVIADPFPDYRRLLPDPRPTSDGVALGDESRTAIIDGPRHTRRRDQDGANYEATVIGVEDDRIVVVPEDTGGIAVNREFLLQAIDAGGDGQLTLALDGPIAPLVIRSSRSTSLLMPVRL